MSARPRSRRAACIVAGLLWHSPLVLASEENAWRANGGLTIVGLATDARGVDEEVTASGDLFLSHRQAAGEWLLYLEGNTSLDRSGVSTVFPEANADAGTALDRDRGGRVQVSEVNFRWHVADRTDVTLGLIDASAYLDRTRITNDENVLFLGVGFVNNPTIEFPDYTLGAALESRLRTTGLQLNAVIAGSNGLADNPNVSYSELLHVRARGRGVFAGAGLGWVTPDQVARLGAWTNTRAHDSLDGRPGSPSNYGVYAVYGRTLGSHAVSVRAGLAREDVSLADRFAAFAYRFAWRSHAVGAGIARTFLSDEARRAGRGDTTQAEIFVRFALTGTRLHVTPAVQYLRHSDLIAIDGDPRNRAWLATTRVHYEF